MWYVLIFGNERHQIINFSYLLAFHFEMKLKKVN